MELHARIILEDTDRSDGPVRSADGDDQN
jgi:hypothetical protein